MGDDDSVFVLLSGIGCLIAAITVLMVLIGKDAFAGVGLAISALGFLGAAVCFVGLYRRHKRK